MNFFKSSYIEVPCTRRKTLAPNSTTSLRNGLSSFQHLQNVVQICEEGWHDEEGSYEDSQECETCDYC